jgi:hypothetical protein
MTTDGEPLPEPDEPWRAEMLAAIESDDVALSTRALRALLSDPVLGGRAQDALDDIGQFAPEPREE